MSEGIRKIDYFYVEAPNKPGEAAKALAALKEAGINLFAFTGFPHGRKAQMDFIPEDTAAFKAAARKAGLKLSARKTGFLIQGEDRIGAVADVAEKLAAASINITALDAVCAGAGRYGALLWVSAPDVRRAAKVLGVSTPVPPQATPVEGGQQQSAPPGPSETP